MCIGMMPKTTWLILTFCCCINPLLVTIIRLPHCPFWQWISNKQVKESMYAKPVRFTLGYGYFRVRSDPGSVCDYY